MYAIIGGSGLAKLAALQAPRRQIMRTPYGEPSGAFTFGALAGARIVFVARHGYGHTIAPHEINYRANIWALKELGVEGVFAVASVGGIRADLAPRSLVVPHQILDYTHSRAATFCERGAEAVTHIDFTLPYTQRLRQRLIAGAQRAGEAVADGAVYACMQGPRLETAAEIDRLERDGADVVGMTGMPEAALAREAGLEYASLGVVVNHAAGRGDSRIRVELSQLDLALREAMVRAVRVLEAAVAGGGMIRPILRMGDPRLLQVSVPVTQFDYAAARRAAGRHVRDDACGRWRRPGRAADRRAAAGGDLRFRAQRALSGCAADAADGAHQSERSSR